MSTNKRLKSRLQKLVAFLSRSLRYVSLTHHRIMDMIVTIRIFRVRSRSRMRWDCCFLERRSCNCRDNTIRGMGRKEG